jgi:hypothetical protein
LFAHFLRKTFCAPPESAVARNYFQAAHATLADRSRRQASSTASPCDAREPLTHADKSAEKKQFRNGGDNAAANTRARRRALGAADRRSAPGWIGAEPENNSPKVLTLEKTVIRFRAADITCRRE